MSNDIFETEQLQVTAFVGKSQCDRLQIQSVQISCKGDLGYAILTHGEALTLAHALLSRVLSIPGYRATD